MFASHITAAMKQKLLIIVGPTASGKSALAVSLARRFNGEVISADSRQVYKGLDIGTAKITKREMEGIPHHLLDVSHPKKIFTVENFKNIMFPNVPRNASLRKILSKKTADELFEILKKMDGRRASIIDLKNKVRLIRAIEIAKSLGKVPEIVSRPTYDSLEIGIDLPDSTLKKNISLRLEKRLKDGMIKEVMSLRQNGLSWKRMFDLGLEYRYISLFLQKKISEDEMREKIFSETWHLAKRQRTWFKRNKKIEWFRPSQISKIERKIKKFV